VDGAFAIAVEPVDVAVATGEQAELGIPRRAFTRHAFLGFDLELGPFFKDGIRREAHTGHEQEQESAEHGFTNDDC
jgi:hypothetical protein